MATRPSVRTRPVTRDKLAAIFKSHELVKAFENMVGDVGEVLPDATEAATAAAELALSRANALRALALVVLDAAGVAAPNARALAVGPGLSLDDSGPGGAVTLDLKFSVDPLVLAEDVSEDAGVFVDVPGLALDLVADAVYVIDGLFTFQSDADVPSIELGFALPDGAALSGRYANSIDTDALTDPPGDPGLTLASGYLVPITGRWMITTSDAGAAQLRFRTSAETYAATLKAGLCALDVRRVA
jgi:hypothetical protein